MSKSSSIFPQVLTRSGLVLLIFFLIGSVTYLNTLNNPFEYDDDVVVVKNVNIREIGNIPRFFFDPSLAANDPKIAGHYRPLVITSYAINYTLGGLSPVGYHLVNLAFHVGSAFLVFLIVSAMSGGMGHGAWAALAAGLIFLVHPFNAEAVNYITARSSLMSGFFYLMGFYCWVRFRGQASGNYSSTIFYIASLLAFVAGMLSKEVVITLPIVLWLYDLYFVESFRGRRLKPYVPYLPFVLIGVIPYLMIRLFSLGRVLDRFQRDMLTQFLTEIPVLVKHWQMFLFPRGLSLIHDVEIYHGLSWPVLLSGLLILLYMGMTIYFVLACGARWRVISFFMVWFFVVLLPTTVIPLNAIFQENRGYLAVVSFTVLAGVGLSELYRRKTRGLMIVVMVILLGVYGTLTVYRNVVWGDSVGLWKDTVAKAPRSGLAYAGLAGAYVARGDFFLSLETARKGIVIAPNNFYLRMNLGRAYQILGETDRAIEEYEKALRIAPTANILWEDLADLYQGKGDIRLAAQYLKKASEVWADQPHIHYNLGVVLAGQGRLGEAEGEFRMAIRLNPAYLQARHKLGETLDRTGRSGEADEQYREIIRLSSGGIDQLSSMPGEDRMVLEEIAWKARLRFSRGK